MGGVYKYLIDYAIVDHLSSLLMPDAEVIRLYRHWPSPEVSWWEASVPLSRDGPNRNVLVQDLGFDMEISKQDFLDWMEDFKQGGMTLVQSWEPLPYRLHPRRFRSYDAFLEVLQDNGAALLFELPHPIETAGLTVFSDDVKKWVTSRNIKLRPEKV